MQYPHWLMVAGAVLVVMKPIDDYESALPAAGWPNWVLDGERVVLDIKEGNMEAHHRLRKKLQAMLSRADAHPVLLERNLNLGKNIPIAGTAHQAGTARFGTDPAVSVLDLDCKAHELDNLYVTDASFFPSIGTVNPTLTIIANALRVADKIKQRLGTKDQPS
jgi:choline dehydrogenase-like flavoprotein